jgi:PadR family transcriptional regulator, regulatory protein PadR
MDLRRQMMQSFWQGILKFFVLQKIAQGPAYGGRLKKQLSECGYDISPGSLYPLLHALEKGSLVSSRVKIFKGRARKYYEITNQGRTVLAELQKELTHIMSKILPLSLNTSGNAISPKFSCSNTPIPSG